MKDNFKLVDNCITEENVNSHFKYEFLPKTIESHLTNFVVNDLETHNKDRAIPYVFCFYRLSKLAGRYNRDLTHDEKQKCKMDTIGFDGDSCVEKASAFCLKLKGEESKEIKNKLLEYNLDLHAHNWSGSDTWIVLSNLSCDKRIVNIIKNGRGNIELKVFEEYKANKKQSPQYLHFRCGMSHSNYSIKNFGKLFKLQKEF